MGERRAVGQPVSRDIFRVILRMGFKKKGNSVFEAALHTFLRLPLHNYNYKPTEVTSHERKEHLKQVRSSHSQLLPSVFKHVRFQAMCSRCRKDGTRMLTSAL